MFDMSNGQMLIQYRPWIAKNEKLVAIQHPPLFRGEILGTQKALPFTDGFLVNLCATADNPSRVELEKDRIALALNLLDADALQGRVAVDQLWP